ncbi:uncharacterized protein [Typha latifolia]|uniref:uncharacterized protein isoform X2 n=1 Tax=Typha latifolia TaxID=4733 RepID=UPI003C2DFF67
MAASTSHNFFLLISRTRHSNYNHHFSIPPNFPSPLEPRSSIASLKRSSKFCQYPIRASSEGVPSELFEESKFVPLNAEDPIYGPPALLLIGFEADETNKVRELLKELDGDFLKVIQCTEDMIEQTVWDAMHNEQPDPKEVKVAKSLPRIFFLSGLTGEEMMMFIDAFQEAGLESAVFAALVPNSADKILGDVIEEIMGDHDMLSGKKSD